MKPVFLKQSEGVSRRMTVQKKEKLLIRFIRPFFAALGFLTLVPLPGFMSGTEEDLSGSLPWFVVVGAMIGAGVALVDKTLCNILPNGPASTVTVVTLIVVSGGLHMDGLADTADGFFSTRSKEQLLEIMRDSRVGAMGVMAIVSVIMLKVSLLTSLDNPTRFMAVFMAPVAGRFAPVYAIVTMKYVRGDAGLGTVFKKSASLVSLCITFVLFFSVCFWVGRYHGLITAVVTILLVTIFSFWCRHKIGGWTGDTLGASVEISETVPPMIILIMAHTGSMT